MRLNRDRTIHYGSGDDTRLLARIRATQDGAEALKEGYTVQHAGMCASRAFRPCNCSPSVTTKLTKQVFN